MDLQVTNADDSKQVVTGVKDLSITDTDSAAALKAKLLPLQTQLATLSKAVSDALAGV